MDTEKIIKIYDEVKSDFKFITNSTVRNKIILSLNQFPQDLYELKDKLNLKSSPILREIKLLQKQNLVYKENNHYFLSPQGKIISLKLESLINAFLTMKNKKIWLNHDISSIPPYFMRNIGCLRDSFMIESTLSDIRKPNTHYKKMLSSVSKIKAVSPIYDYSYVEVYLNSLQKDIEVDLIFTEPVMQKINEIFNQKEIIETISNSKNLGIWKIEAELKIAFTVTEEFFSMGLFLENGTYDSTLNLVSKDEKAITWGNRLFEYYLKDAQKVAINFISKN